jgi:hypothetical protein
MGVNNYNGKFFYDSLLKSHSRKASPYNDLKARYAPEMFLFLLLKKFFFYFIPKKLPIGQLPQLSFASVAF